MGDSEVGSGGGSPVGKGKEHSSTSTSSSASNPEASRSSGEGEGPKCAWCGEAYRDPRVLACFHTFCRHCLAHLSGEGASLKLQCPTCRAETQLSPELGLDSLLADYGLVNSTMKELEAESISSASSPGLLDTPPTAIVGPTCTGCKSKESGAVAHCIDCSNFLCTNCVMAHQYMHCFEGHRVRELSDLDTRALARLPTDPPVSCLSHRKEPVRFFCFTCNIPVCQACTLDRHPRPHHHLDPLPDILDKELDNMHALLVEARAKRVAVAGLSKLVEGASSRLRASHATAHSAVNDSANALLALIEEQRQVAFKELENTHGTKQASLTLLEKKLSETGDRLEQTVDFMTRLLKHASGTESLLFKQLLETRLQNYLAYPTDVGNLNQICELNYVPNTMAQMRQSVTGIFGYVRSGNATANPGAIGDRAAPTPIGRPPSRSRFISLNLNHGGPTLGGGVLSPGGPLSSSLGDSGLGVESPPFSDSLGLKGAFGGSSQSLGPFPPFSDSLLYEKWSTTGTESAIGGLGSLHIATPHSDFPTSPDSILGSDLAPPRQGPPGGGVGGGALVGLFPPRSQIKRQKMIYHCKFGEFGVLESQFTEPSGVCVNAQNDIIVADTNNHRIQVFDREGRFKFQFGECGKRDGQLLYPNRVAVNRATGDIVVTERSPTHQIQVYNQYGQFLRKFGANILQHPRGVTVDSKGRIVVIECKVMRVLIFDHFGSILQKFSCSRYLEFPNGVCTNDRQEIFISDNRAHCIKVFNYEGQFLRQLGGEGITNYPIGVGINHLGEVVVADNHNNFNLSIFNQDGTLVNALESKVKHAQCFDVALLEEGSVVLASKDYRLYLYRYMQGQPSFPT